MKNLKYLLLILPFLFIGSVKADDLQLSLNNYYATYKNEIGVDKINNIINEVLEEYKSNYMSDYPYYFISIGGYDLNGFYIDSTFTVSLFYSLDIPEFSWFSTSSGDKILGIFSTFDNYSGSISRTYDIYRNNVYVFGSSFISNSSISPGTIFHLDSNSNPKKYLYFPCGYYASNFDLYLPSINSVLKDFESGFLFDYDNILIPTLDESNLSTVISFDRDDYLVEPFYLYDSDIDIELNTNLVEVNLNDYSYIALSLKDYNQKPFTSMQYVKGEYCINGVYDYGLSSKEKYDSSITDICSPYYNDFTPVELFILERDIKNHAIYYLKARDTSKENKIRVDSSIFNIHYITEEEADNPVININGRNYSILPFDELPSNSIKNTEEGNWPGASEEFSFSDIFTAPLEFLKDVWNSIVNVFDLIIEFIYLLPKELQGFLTASFYLAVAVGLLKILL